MFLVYALVDPRTDDRFYIGQSSIGLERPQQHMRATALREKTAKADYVRALLAFGHTPRIEILQTLEDPDESIPPPLHCWTGGDICALDAAEMWWIAHGRAAGWPLTNRTFGGDRLRGLPRTAEHNAKISASRIGNQWSKGIPKSDEHRAKLSTARKRFLAENPKAANRIAGGFTGKSHSDETKAKMRAAANPHNRGKSASSELRAKLSAAHKGQSPSREHRRKLGAAVLGEKNGMFGKSHSADTLSKIRMTKRARATGKWFAYQLAGIR